MAEIDRVPSELSELVLPDADGAPHRLGDLWKERPALLLWVRHFG
jgi:hypothetical protein